MQTYKIDERQANAGQALRLTRLVPHEEHYNLPNNVPILGDTRENPFLNKMEVSLKRSQLLRLTPLFLHSLRSIRRQLDVRCNGYRSNNSRNNSKTSPST